MRGSRRDSVVEQRREALWEALRGRNEAEARAAAEILGKEGLRSFRIWEPDFASGAPGLIWAAMRGEPGLGKAMLDAGADPNERWGKRGSALHLATREGLFGMVEDLLRAGADPKAKDRAERTALHWAVSRNAGCMVSDDADEQCWRALIRGGADPSQRDDGGRTAGHDAAERGNAKALRDLLDAGLDWSLLDGNLESAGHLAAEEGRKECLELLLDAGWAPKGIELARILFAARSAGRGEIATELAARDRAKTDAKALKETLGEEGGAKSGPGRGM